MVSTKLSETQRRWTVMEREAYGVLVALRIKYQPEHQSAQMSKITNDGLTRSGCWMLYIAGPIWQQWA